MDHETEGQIIACFYRLDQILPTGIFTRDEKRNPFVQSAFIEVIILLRDLMHKCEKFGRRISFTDDVNTSHDVADISDAIRHVRDAACHLDSKKRVATPSGTISTRYDDDVCFIYGRHHLYLRRHVVRAYLEARSHLREMSWGLDAYCSTSDSIFAATSGT